ncbi:hypothetical protein NMG60_11028478 [Bertholletia excelsa]
MEEDQEQGFLCKICRKRFPSGKSLGGHMRGHLSAISAKSHEDQSSPENASTVSSDSSQGIQENLKNIETIYGLRENPKKSWRVSSAKQGIRTENRCNECGKEFSSLRALSGHMRCHSRKDKVHVCEKCGKGFDSDRALFGHMRHHSKRPRERESQSEHENALLVRRKRSRMRYKTNLNASSCSSFSEIDEVEEAAICLVMLSRGVRSWAEFESSENETLVLKDEGIALDQGGILACKVKDRFDSSVSCSGYSLCDKNEPELGDLNSGDERKNLDPGYIRKNQKKTELVDLDSGNVIKNKKLAEFEVLVNGFQGIDELKNPIMEDISGIELSAAETETGSEPSEAELERDLVTQPEGEIENFAEEQVELKKVNYHECPICAKVFPSGQALGGHKRAHYTGFSENKTNESVLNIQELPEVHKIFDLNLSGGIEKLVNDDVGLKPWWIESDHEREPLVILIEQTDSSLKCS